LISNLQANTVPCHHTIDFQDKATQQKFDKWMSKSKQIRIRAVSAFTGQLDIVAYIDDIFVET